MSGLAELVAGRALRDFAQCEKLRDVPYRVGQLCDFVDVPQQMPRLP
jgi:hypothetical protein